MDKRMGRLLVLILIVGSTAMLGCGHKEPAAPDSIPVTVQTVATATGAAGGAYSANIVADTQVDVAFKVNGYVQSILQVKGADGKPRNVQAGDAAKADFGRYTHLLAENVASKADYDTAKQQYESAQASVGAANASVQQAQVDLDDCKLKSPMSALVLDRTIEVGTLVAPSTVGFQIGDTAKVKVVF